MKKRYLKLDDIVAYKESTELSDAVYLLVSTWGWFEKRTLGSQWVDATDSIAGNIAEGFGRFHKKDKEKFYYNARGSVYESAHWARRAMARELISEKDFTRIIKTLRTLPKAINYQIRITEYKLKR